LIAFPAMSDGRRPLTAAFLRAKRTADALRPAPGAMVTEQRVAEDLDAVGNYALAFEVGEQGSRRLRDSTSTADQRKRPDRGHPRLKIGRDESATQAERQVAYRRVRDELEGLILLSDEAVQVLETKVAGELTRGGRVDAVPEPERMRLKRDDPSHD